MISLLWCYLLAGTARNLVFSATNRFYATLKTGILTLLVFIILVSTIAINRLPINELLDISVFLSVTSGELLKLCWYSLLSPVVFGVFVFFANHLVLNAFDIEGAITWDGAVMYCRLTAEEDEETGKESKNPYNSILNWMNSFQSEFKKVELNRLACVQGVGNSEMNWIYSSQSTVTGRKTMSKNCYTK